MTEEELRMCGILVACAIALSIPVAAEPAEASLIGNTVGAQFLQPNTVTVLANPGTAIVNGLQLFTILNTAITVTATQAIFRFNVNSSFSSNPFSGFRLYDLTSPFTAVSLNAATTVPGLVAADVFLSGPYAYVNMEGLSATTSQRIVLDLVTADMAGQVAEPWSASLLGAGLCGVALARRQRRAGRSPHRAGH